MNTRVPFDDDYVKLIGTAVYLFSYYEWAIIYVVERLEPALVHNSRSRSIIALHPEIRGPA